MLRRIYKISFMYTINTNNMEIATSAKVLSCYLPKINAIRLFFFSLNVQ